MSNLLAQKQEIKRLEKDWVRQKNDEDEQKWRDEDIEQEKRVREFEAVQAGLDIRLRQGAKGRKLIGREGGKVVIEETADTRGTKRKLEIDEDEIIRLGKEHTASKRKAIEDKPSLPSFWVPSETPTSGAKSTEKPAKAHAICPSSTKEDSHDFSLKTWVDVQFSQEKESSTDEHTKVCPSCNKTLSNTTKAVLARPCGHVVCKACADKFLKPTQSNAHEVDAEIGVVRCYVCQADVTERKRLKKEGREKIRPGLVEISTEGTGFAGGGKNIVKRSGVAFQC